MLGRTGTQRPTVSLQENMRMTTNRHSWNAGVHVEMPYDVMTILKVE